ncbi:fimbrial biogenesis chaperone [Mixta gaviniae]|nr:fimbria/pilus periplasmic chaperone [Mixta gaviniae]
MNIKFLLLLFSGLLLNATCTLAGIVVNSTRVIYPEGEREVTARLENQNQHPSLIQSWIDNGKKDEEIKAINVPFILLPPVARVEPQQGQTLRITYVGEASTLPKDRESVFWLNILDIPPRAKAAAGNPLQMAIRTRIKLFFRPEALKGESAAEAAEKLGWRRIESKEGVTLEANNRSPFYVSIASIETSTAPKPANKLASIKGDMIAPFSHARFTFPASLKTLSQFKYHYINDYGAVVTMEREI